MRNTEVAPTIVCGIELFFVNRGLYTELDDLFKNLRRIAIGIWRCIASKVRVFSLLMRLGISAIDTSVDILCDNGGHVYPFFGAVEFERLVNIGWEVEGESFRFVMCSRFWHRGLLIVYFSAVGSIFCYGFGLGTALSSRVAGGHCAAGRSCHSIHIPFLVAVSVFAVDTFFYHYILLSSTADSFSWAGTAFDRQDSSFLGSAYRVSICAPRFWRRRVVLRWLVLTPLFGRVAVLGSVLPVSWVFSIEV